MLDTTIIITVNIAIEMKFYLRNLLGLLGPHKFFFVLYLKHDSQV